MDLSSSNDSGDACNLSTMSYLPNAIIIHGWGADSQSNWFPWLKIELEKRGINTTVPDFPNTQNPKLAEWLRFFEQNLSVDTNTILIGHSLGVPFILRLLERLPESQKVKACFLVSGFTRPLGYTETESFVVQPLNWVKVRACSNKFVVINSDDDPYIPLALGQELAKNLGVELIVEHNAGHINAPGGFLAYPELLKLILKCLFNN